MKVLYDLVATQPLGGSTYHGGGEYAKALFEAALKKGYTCDALYDSQKPLDPYIRALCEEYTVPLIDLGGRPFSAVYRDYDTFFTGLPYGRFTPSSPEDSCRLVYTIHGIRSLEMPLDRYDMAFYLSARNWKRLLKGLFFRLFPRTSRKIASKKMEDLLRHPQGTGVTVSFHSKYSLLTFFPFLREEDFVVCYSPLFSPLSKEEVEAAAPETLEKLGLEGGSYYLGLGSGRWLKNNLRLARAFDRLVSQGRLGGRRLVLTGGYHGVYKGLRNPGSFLFLDYVEPRVLEVLLREARGLLYPSLNEGFGYPPLQAMRYGTPVVASAFSAVPEVCGSAALYANPYSEEEIAGRILMLENEEIHQTYSLRGAERYGLLQGEQERMLEELLDLIFKGASLGAPLSSP